MAQRPRSPIQPAAPSLSRRAFIGETRPLFQYKPGWPNSPAAPSLSRRAFIGRARPLFQYKPLAPAGGLRVNHHPTHPFQTGLAQQPAAPYSPQPHRYREGLLLGRHGPYSNTSPWRQPGDCGSTTTHPSIPNRDGPTARCPIAIAKGFYWGNTAPIPFQTGMAQ